MTRYLLYTSNTVQSLHEKIDQTLEYITWINALQKKVLRV